MPFKRIEEYNLNLFYLINPDPRDFLNSSINNLPRSREFKEGLPTIVLIHSAAGTVKGWYRQFGDSRLAGNFNLLAVDCMYNGWTNGADDREDLTLEDSANSIFTLLDGLALEDLHLVGEAVMGANIAAWIAIKRAEKVKSLLLASPGWRQESPDVLAALASVQKGLLINKIGNGGDDSGTFPEESGGPLDNIVDYFISSLPRLADARQEMRTRFQERYGRGQPLHDVQWLFVAVMDRKAIPLTELAKVKCPTLILRGSEDLIVSPERACEEWRRSFVNAPNGGASIHVIVGAPSLISLSDSNVVNRICSQFCSRAQQQQQA